jgi:hypothetical protein
MVILGIIICVLVVGLITAIAVDDLMTRTELQSLDEALSTQYSDGKITMAEWEAYLHHAAECDKQGIRRKNWTEFFTRPRTAQGLEA